MRFHGRAAMASVCLAAFGCAPSDDTGGRVAPQEPTQRRAPAATRGTSGNTGTSGAAGAAGSGGHGAGSSGTGTGGSGTGGNGPGTGGSGPGTGGSGPGTGGGGPGTGGSGPTGRGGSTGTGGAAGRGGATGTGGSATGGTGGFVNHPAHRSDPVCGLQRHTDDDVVMPRLGESLQCTITVNGTARQYYLNLPSGYDGPKSVPSCGNTIRSAATPNKG